MYETEANILVETIQEFPPEALEAFRAGRKQISARTVLPWGEHCTECAWPTCYTTCDLYSPREDGRCRRFIDGMVRVDCPGSVTSYLLKIRFKRWGKLWAPGNTRLFPIDHADRIERCDRKIGSTFYQLPLPAPARKFATTKRYSWKKRAAAGASPAAEGPDLFVVECYNPGAQQVSLSLAMFPAVGAAGLPYQRLIHVLPGFHREEIAVNEIARVLNLGARFSIDLIPNDIPDDTLLYFGAIDFVKSAAKPVAPAEERRPVKCIVWDLDNTLWSGILVEDGAEKLVLKPGIAGLLKDLDRHGILHSVASKNNAEETLAVLRRHSLDEYFLHPQISWAPKSEALKTIAQKLNIGIDTLLFIDDSEFELAEVQSACPSVQTLDAERYLELLELPERQASVTEEGSARRKMYQQEAAREIAAAGFAGDYLAFLRNCGLEMEIEPLSAVNLERVHELTQRTNQMNFSGNRYGRELLAQISATPHLDTYVITCRDRFGNYGVVGFSVVDSREPRMTDLMFSCRVQAKRVEHAFLAYLLKRYIPATGSDFWANYRKTPRNAPSGRVFDDLGMEEKDSQNGVTSLVFRCNRSIPDDGITTILEKESLAPTARYAVSPHSR